MREILTCMETGKQMLVGICAYVFNFWIISKGMSFGHETIAGSAPAYVLSVFPWVWSLQYAFFYSFFLSFVITTSCHRYWSFKVRNDMDPPFIWETKPVNQKYKYGFVIFNYGATSFIQFLTLLSWFLKEKRAVLAQIDEVYSITITAVYDKEMIFLLEYKQKEMAVLFGMAVLLVPAFNALIGFHNAQPFRSSEQQNKEKNNDSKSAGPPR